MFWVGSFFTQMRIRSRGPMLTLPRITRRVHGKHSQTEGSTTRRVNINPNGVSDRRITSGSRPSRTRPHSKRLRFAPCRHSKKQKKVRSITEYKWARRSHSRRVVVVFPNLASPLSRRAAATPVPPSPLSKVKVSNFAIRSATRRISLWRCEIQISELLLSLVDFEVVVAVALSVFAVSLCFFFFWFFALYYVWKTSCPLSTR